MEGSVSAPSDFVWYISRDGQQFGPVSADEFARLEDQSRLRPTDQVWQTGMKEWIAYSDFDARKAGARCAGKHRPTSSKKADNEKCAICLLVRRALRALKRASIIAFHGVSTRLAKIHTLSASSAAGASQRHAPEGAVSSTVHQSPGRLPAPILASLRGAREPTLQRPASVPQQTASGAITHGRKDDRDSRLPDVRTESAIEPLRHSPTAVPRLVSEEQAVAHIGLELATFRAWVASS